MNDVPTTYVGLQIGDEIMRLPWSSMFTRAIVAESRAEYPATDDVLGHNYVPSVSAQARWHVDRILTRDGHAGHETIARLYVSVWLEPYQGADKADVQLAAEALFLAGALDEMLDYLDTVGVMDPVIAQAYGWRR